MKAINHWIKVTRATDTDDNADEKCNKTFNMESDCICIIVVIIEARKTAKQRLKQQE
jgi:hypothetical protein